MYNWKLIDEDFLDFLRTKETRIPKTNYGLGKMKPFFGELFEKDGLAYVTQISSAKPRHLKMKQTLDFLKFYDSKNDLVFVVNLNYMFPVPKKYLSNLNYAYIYSLKSPTEASKYISFLKNELKMLNSQDITKKALRIYQLKQNNPNHVISNRCFDFLSLENACHEYIKMKDGTDDVSL